MPKMPTEIKSLARSYTNSALSVLKSIMQQPDAPPAARVTAAIALLDRGWGKPDQSKDVTIRHAKANQVPQQAKHPQQPKPGPLYGPASVNARHTTPRRANSLLRVVLKRPAQPGNC
jgi:hypothetical protein